MANGFVWLSWFSLYNLISGNPFTFWFPTLQFNPNNLCYGECLLVGLVNGGVPFLKGSSISGNLLENFSNQFAIVYSISLFTNLSENFQRFFMAISNSFHQVNVMKNYNILTKSNRSMKSVCPFGISFPTSAHSHTWWYIGVEGWALILFFSFCLLPSMNHCCFEILIAINSSILICHGTFT